MLLQHVHAAKLRANARVLLSLQEFIAQEPEAAFPAVLD